MSDTATDGDGCLKVPSSVPNDDDPLMLENNSMVTYHKLLEAIDQMRYTARGSGTGNKYAQERLRREINNALLLVDQCRSQLRRQSSKINSDKVSDSTKMADSGVKPSCAPTILIKCCSETKMSTSETVTQPCAPRKVVSEPTVLKIPSYQDKLLANQAQRLRRELAGKTVSSSSTRSSSTETITKAYYDRGDWVDSKPGTTSNSRILKVPTFVPQSTDMKFSNTSPLFHQPHFPSFPFVGSK